MPDVSWGSFAQALRAAREAAGFPSARAFHNKSGGRKFFGMTYRQYLNVENGLSGPGAKLVERISLALQLSSDKRRSREFFRAYLRCLVASDDLLEVILLALASPPPAGGCVTPMQKALARQSEARATLLSRDQADCIDASLENFWLWNLLINDSARWTPAQLEKATGIKEGVVASSLKALHKQELLSRDAQGRWYCDKIRRVFRFPREEHFALGRDKHDAYIDRISAVGGGRPLFRHYTLFRGSEREILDYAPNLRAAVEGANICETAEKGPDTGLTVVEVVARKLFSY